MNRRERDLRRLLAEDGYAIVQFTIARHYRIVVRKHGVEFTITCSRSPSDFRALVNMRFQIRREFERHSARTQSTHNNANA